MPSRRSDELRQNAVLFDLVAEDPLGQAELVGRPPLLAAALFQRVDDQLPLLVGDDLRERRLGRDAGVVLAPAVRLAGAGSTVSIPMPLPAMGRGYLVVRIVAHRGLWASPRPVDVHVAVTQGNARVVGVRH